MSVASTREPTAADAKGMPCLGRTSHQRIRPTGTRCSMTAAAKAGSTGSPTGASAAPSSTSWRTSPRSVTTMARSSVCLASDREAFIFDLNTQNSKANKEAIQSNFDVFWSKYRVFIIFALFVTMVVILIYIFQKSQQSKNNIVNEN